MRLKFFPWSSLCLLMMQKCSNPHEKVVDGEFVRVTSAIDSARQMAVVYRSMIDSNKVFTRSYWDNGDLQGFSTFYKRKKHGQWIHYYKGIVTYRGQYVNDRKDGAHIYFTDKGDTSIIEYYKMGEKVGRWMSFDSLGLPYKAEEYSDTLIDN